MAVLADSGGTKVFGPGSVQTCCTVAGASGGVDGSSPVGRSVTAVLGCVCSQATIPGIGVIIALTLAIEIDPAAFKSGRHLAAWIGLTPKEHSTAGKQCMGGISRAGNERLRRLLVTGATAVIRFATRPGNKQAKE